MVKKIYGKKSDSRAGTFTNEYFRLDFYINFLYKFHIYRARFKNPEIYPIA